MILEILSIYVFVSFLFFIGMLSYEHSLRKMNKNQKETIDNLSGLIDSEREKRYDRNLLAVFGCGAKIAFYEPEEIMHLSRGRLDEQTKPFRNGGVFIDCNPSCTMRETCALMKKLGQHSLTEGFTLSASTPGATLRADCNDGQWKLRLVRHGDKWLIDVVVDGIVVHGQRKPLFVVPPLLQVLKKRPEDNRDK